MKKIKIIAVIFLAILLAILPNNIFAESCFNNDVYKKTLDEVETFLNNLDNLKKENGEYTINLPIVKPELLYKNALLNLEEYKIIHKKLFQESDVFPTEEELIDSMNEQNRGIKFNSVYGAIRNYFIGIGLEENEFDISIDYDSNTNTNNYNLINLSIHYLSEENEGLSYTIKTKVKYLEEVDSEILSKAQELSEKIDVLYEHSDMSVFNSIYHYGTYSDIIHKNSLALYQYPKLKEILEQNKEFEFKSFSESGGDTPVVGIAEGFISIIKDGVIYSTAFTEYVTNQVMYVDKDLEGTPIEKLINRVDDYFNGKIEYEITKSNDIPYQMYYELDGQKYPITLVKAKIGNYNSYLSIIEVDSKYIKELEVSAKDYETDISISTEGYEVPVDATLNVENKKNDKNIISLLNKYNYRMIDAYNIDIIKTRSNEKVTKIEDGVEVFIPIKDYKVEDIITIRHIKEDGTLGEVLQGKVTEKDGKLYAKFRTTHFSTYALVEEIVKEEIKEDEIKEEIKEDEIKEDVPKTFDNVTNYIMVGFVGIIGLAGTVIICKKKEFN